MSTQLGSTQLPVVPHHTIGVSGDPDRLGIPEGEPTHRRIILRVTRGSGPQLVVADIELDERGALLTGLGALGAGTTAVWTVSFLDPIPRVGNEIG